MRFIDSHLHISEYEDPQALVNAARRMDTTVLAVSIDRSSSSTTLSLSSEAPRVVKGFVGVHPSEAGKERDLGWVRGMMKGAIGVGEIGLDLKYSADSPMEHQRRAFLEQLVVGEECEKPVQMHTRGRKGSACRWRPASD